MRRIALFTGLFMTLAASAWFVPSAASAAALAVCPSGCEYRQLAPAIAAAPRGGIVDIAAGTYRGGFRIGKNLVLIGAGAGRTIIKGGGPVITIGTPLAQTEPTVTLEGITVVGGRTTSSLGHGYSALGGGVFIPPAAGYTTGATVTIRRSVIAHNLAAPANAVDSGIACPGRDCLFAHAGGGGIDSWGDLTVEHTTIADNAAAGRLTSDANGGGLYVQRGKLTLVHSIVTGNRSTAGRPDGRFAEGAGVMVDTFFSPPGTAPTLFVDDSLVRGNSSTLTSRLPAFFDGQQIQLAANAGGIHVGDAIPVTVQNTLISDNRSTATDPDGEPIGIDAAMIVGDGPLTMRNTVIEGNQTTTTAATSADVGPSGDTLELDGPGTIANTRIDANITTSFSAKGVAGAIGALAILPEGQGDHVIVVDSVISNNVTQARSRAGSATAQGSGVFTNGLLQLRRVRVAHNIARATAPTGFVQGGGIWNGVDLAGPPVHLELFDSTIANNSLTGSPGLSLRGGGLFTTSPVTITNTRIAHNRPGQCSGC